MVKKRLDAKWSSIWMPNGPVFECHLNTAHLDHLYTWQKDTILFSYVLVGYFNGQSNKCSSQTHVLFSLQQHTTIINNKPFEMRTTKSLGINVSIFQMIDSDPHCMLNFCLSNIHMVRQLNTGTVFRCNPNTTPAQFLTTQLFGALENEKLY